MGRRDEPAGSNAMSPEQYEKLKKLFNEALELDEAARAEFAARVDDAELRAELEKLLAGDVNAADTLEHSPIAAFISTARTGDVIGRYKITGELGKGGMGSVFLAERTDLKGRPVALKIIRREVDSAEMLSRFQTERDILATLEHPNIARFLDSGTTDEGLPFFVMEYVEGEDIDAYCASRGLSLKSRLEIFRKVCAAVGYAHSRLIVHRDLKPSNILVTKDGEPKLLDFGIAKFASLEPADTPGTATALGMMTPKYASPEQLRGETVGTSTDIYSLGVILFELLTGTLPYDIGGKRIDEIIRAVCETEPERPSSAVSHAGTNTDANSVKATGARHAGVRTNAPSNPKLLRGDLDNILLKALRKEPERRYPTVEQFSEDIRRHLDGLPVTARADTFSYRASKFVRRNRGAVISAGVVAAVLLAGVVGTAWQAVRAEQARVKAEERFADVRAIANNVVFKYYDEIAKTPGTTKVREMLITDAIEYLDRLSRDAADNVELSRELAKAYLRIGDLQAGIGGPSSIGDISSGIENMQKAVALLEAAAGRSQDPELLGDLRDAYSDLGQTLNRAGDDRKTEYLQKAVAVAERLVRDDPNNADKRLELAVNHIFLGDITPDDETVLVNKGDVYFGSKAEYLKAMEMIDAVLASDPGHRKALERKMQAGSRLSANYQMAADAQGTLGNAEKKRELALKALEYGSAARVAAEKVLSFEPDNFDLQYNVSALRWNESLIQALLGEHQKALEIQAREIADAEKIVAADPNDADSAHALAVRYDGISATHTFMKNYTEAMAAQQKALEITGRLTAKDPQNLEFLQTNRDIGLNLAATLGNLGRTEESVAKFRSVIAEFKRSALMAGKDAEVAYYEGLVHERIGNEFKRSKRLAMAAAEYRKAIELWRSPKVTEAFFSKNSDQINAVERKLAECEAGA